MNEHFPTFGTNWALKCCFPKKVFVQWKSSELFVTLSRAFLPPATTCWGLLGGTAGRSGRSALGSRGNLPRLTRLWRSSVCGPDWPTSAAPSNRNLQREKRGESDRRANIDGFLQIELGSFLYQPKHWILMEQSLILYRKKSNIHTFSPWAGNKFKNKIKIKITK